MSMNAPWVSVNDVLGGPGSTGNLSKDDRVLLKGWIRTRRDSKAGLSFLHLHDGTCFDPVQVVVHLIFPITKRMYSG